MQSQPWSVGVGLRDHMVPCCPCTTLLTVLGQCGSKKNRMSHTYTHALTHTQIHTRILIHTTETHTPHTDAHNYDHTPHTDAHNYDHTPHTDAHTRTLQVSFDAVEAHCDVTDSK